MRIDNNKVKIVLNYSMIKYIALAFGFIKGIVNAKFLGPELMGVLGNLILVLSYCTYANLGVLNSMNSEYVLYKDKEPEEAKKVIETTFAFLLILSVIFIISSFSSMVVLRGQQKIFFSLVFMIAVFEQFRLFYINYARLIDKYRVINIIELIHNVVSLVFIMIFINSLHITGVLLAMLICGIIVYFVGIRSLDKIKPRISKYILRDLLIVGVPLLIYNLGFYLLTTIDRWIIIAKLDYTQLGYYTFANQIVSATLVFVKSILFLYYPKAIKKYNESNESKSILRAIKDNTKLLELVSVALIILGFIGFYPFVKFMVPEFLKSTKVYYILLMAVISNSLAYFANVYIVSNKKQIYLILLQLISIFLNLTLNITFVKLNFGLLGIAFATMISNIVYSLIQHMIFNKIKVGSYKIGNAIVTYSKIIIFFIIISILVCYEIEYFAFITIVSIAILIIYGRDFFRLAISISKKYK